MASETEPAKLLLPYLQRADELQKHEPLVAYYSRLYAMERGLNIPHKDRTKMTNSILVSIINQLEKILDHGTCWVKYKTNIMIPNLDRKSLNLGSDDKLHVEGFASSVFSKADKQDRAGRADLNTAKTFYAASIFFEILSQFGDEQTDLEQKRKYAVWKAADIRKALKEGRKPVPGPPDNDPSVLSTTSSGEYDLELSRSNSGRTNPTTSIPPDSDLHPYQKPYPHQSTNTSPHPSNNPPSISPVYPTDYSPENFHQPPPSEYSLRPHSFPQDSPTYPYTKSQSFPGPSESNLPTAPSHHPSYYQGSPDASSYSNYPPGTQYDPVANNNNVPEASQVSKMRYEYDSSYQPLPEQIAEAHKAARFAVGALAFDDVAVAVDFLSKSLELLTKPSAGQ